ncbi:MAG: 2-polyprenylphenol 6-hydroxylase, partial [Alphaproteobacteria bacterium]|nr:2-polyprenylphenol 6-hydroxylase [Alphaproteobacteria bacterium]
MISGIKNFMRAIALLKALARHDALWPLQMVSAPKPVICLLKLLWGKKHAGRPGEKLADALAAMGPTYIKLGQALSVRADLVGEEVAKDLSRLQDKLPAFPFEKVRETIET